MTTLSPIIAAELAQEAYQTQDELSLELFLERKEFAKEQTSLLKAQVGTRLINTFDGFGLCARGGGHHKGESFIMFRGTTTANYGADIFTDARLGIGRSETGLPVHIGFNHAFNSTLPTIKNFIANNNDTTIHSVGHSLGGAVATLAADWLVKNTGKNVQLYTFGSPRVGTDWFSKSVTTRLSPKNIYRVFHETDPVGMVPIYPFIHTTAKPYKPVTPSLPLTSGQAHFMSNYVASVKNKNWLELQDGGNEKYTLETSIKRWLESTSPVSASSPQFWQ